MGKLHQSASTYGIKPSTASNIWTKYKNMGTTKNRPHSGCPLKLTDCEMTGGMELCQGSLETLSTDCTRYQH